MDNTHSDSRTVGFRDFEKKQTLTSSYKQPTDVAETADFGGFQLFWNYFRKLFECNKILYTPKESKAKTFCCPNQYLVTRL